MAPYIERPLCQNLKHGLCEFHYGTLSKEFHTELELCVTHSQSGMLEKISKNN